MLPSPPSRRTTPSTSASTTSSKSQRPSESIGAQDEVVEERMSKLDTAITSPTVDLQKEWTESPQHPQNWPDRRRWTIALVIALTGFLVRDFLVLPWLGYSACALTPTRSPAEHGRLVRFCRRHSDRPGALRHEQGNRDLDAFTLPRRARMRTVCLCAVERTLRATTCLRRFHDR